MVRYYSAHKIRHTLSAVLPADPLKLLVLFLRNPRSDDSIAFDEVHFTDGPVFRTLQDMPA